ncbi:MAG: radical SAM protein [Candidatus Aenigmatarchaeota archaeon]
MNETNFPKVREVICKSALSKCGLEEFSYSVNPYTGCAHGCVYCYARFMCKYGGHLNEPWGSFVDVKTNIAEVLRKDMQKNHPGRIFLSSVTDPYQPLEAKYLITQKTISAIRDYNYPLTVFTKSSLAKRDLKAISGIKNPEFWVSIVLLEERERKIWEPFASPIEERLRTLRVFSEAEVPSYAFLGPVLPEITTRKLPEIFSRFAEAGVKGVTVDRLNIKCGNLQPILKTIREHYPQLLLKYRELFIYGKDKVYYKNLKPEIESAAKKAGLYVEFCF